MCVFVCFVVGAHMDMCVQACGSPRLLLNRSSALFMEENSLSQTESLGVRLVLLAS